MIMEHNYDELFFLEIDTPRGPRFLDKRWHATQQEEQAISFLGINDARRYSAIHYSRPVRVVKIEFPYRLEYDIHKGLAWQKMRVFRTKEAGLEGFDRYIEDVRGGCLGGHIWRLVDKAGRVYAELVPDERPGR